MTGLPTLWRRDNLWRPSISCHILPYFNTTFTMITMSTMSTIPPWLPFSLVPHVRHAPHMAPYHNVHHVSPPRLQVPRSHYEGNELLDLAITGHHLHGSQVYLHLQRQCTAEQWRADKSSAEKSSAEKSRVEKSSAEKSSIDKSSA